MTYGHNNANSLHHEFVATQAKYIFGTPAEDVEKSSVADFLCSPWPVQLMIERN